MNVIAEKLTLEGRDKELYTSKDYLKHIPTLYVPTSRTTGMTNYANKGLKLVSPAKKHKKEEKTAQGEFETAENPEYLLTVLNAKTSVSVINNDERSFWNKGSPEFPPLRTIDQLLKVTKSDFEKGDFFQQYYTVFAETILSWKTTTGNATNKFRKIRDVATELSKLKTWVIASKLDGMFDKQKAIMKRVTTQKVNISVATKDKSKAVAKAPEPKIVDLTVLDSTYVFKLRYTPIFEGHRDNDRVFKDVHPDNTFTHAHLVGQWRFKVNDACKDVLVFVEGNTTYTRKVTANVAPDRQFCFFEVNSDDGTPTEIERKLSVVVNFSKVIVKCLQKMKGPTGRKRTSWTKIWVGKYVNTGKNIQIIKSNAEKKKNEQDDILTSLSFPGVSKFDAKHSITFPTLVKEVNISNPSQAFAQITTMTKDNKLDDIWVDKSKDKKHFGREFIPRRPKEWKPQISYRPHTTPQKKKPTTTTTSTTTKLKTKPTTTTTSTNNNDEKKLFYYDFQGDYVMLHCRIVFADCKYPDLAKQLKKDYKNKPCKETKYFYSFKKVPYGNMIYFTEFVQQVSDDIYHLLVFTKRQGIVNNNNTQTIPRKVVDIYNWNARSMIQTIWFALCYINPNFRQCSKVMQQMECVTLYDQFRAFLLQYAQHAFMAVREENQNDASQEDKDDDTNGDSNVDEDEDDDIAGDDTDSVNGAQQQQQQHNNNNNNTQHQHVDDNVYANEQQC